MMTATLSDSGRPPDRKAVLFCFECGHESSVPGDWDLEQRDGCEAYRCPDCGTTITVRPEDESRTVRSDERSAHQCYCAGD